MRGLGHTRRFSFALCLFLLVRTGTTADASSKPDTLAVVKTKLPGTTGDKSPINTGDKSPIKAGDKSPRGAMLRSAIIPGWGQWYANQPIRAVVAFCGVAGLVGTAVYQNQRVVRSSFMEERDFYLNNRSQAVWWCAGVYFLNILDAYIDAHLWHFDTGPDLTFQPEFEPIGNYRLGLSWSFH